MPWPITTATSIAARFAANLEAGLAKVIAFRGLVVDPVRLSAAVRSRIGVFAQIGRSIALEVREIHDHVEYWSRQIFVDTAEEENVFRHADMWGIDQRPATKAVGQVLVEGIAGTALPSGIELSASSGVIFVTTEAGEIGEDGHVTLSAEAEAAGPLGNIEDGIRLSTVAPYPEIARVTVSAPGFAGGASEETPEELQAATQAHIRQRPHGGAGFDYPDWLGRAFAVRAVSVEPEWIGRGSVGVIVAMQDGAGGGRVPTPEELTAMLAHLGPLGSPTGVRPVTAHVVVVACELEELALTVRLRPDTAQNRAAVTDAWQRFVATIGDEDDEGNESPIGATIEPSRIIEAISAAAGEYAHDLIVPAARFTLGDKKFPTAGVPTFEDPL